MAVVDALGKTCPQPVIMAAKELDALAEAGDAGEAVEVLVDNMVAVENLKRLANSRGRAAEVVEEEAGARWRVVIAGGEPGDPDGSGWVPADPFEPVCDIPVPAAAAAAGKVVAVGGEFMGRGDQELGAILMKGLIYALANAENPPVKMVFFNGGARLTCEGSASLEDIRELESRACEILTCGTCLDFYGIKDRLAVGGVTNLYQISEIFLAPEGVVSL